MYVACHVRVCRRSKTKTKHKVAQKLLTCIPIRWTQRAIPSRPPALACSSFDN